MSYDPNSDRSKRQLEGVQKWIDSGCKSTLVYATGFGKTTVAIICIKKFLDANPECKADVIVPTETLYNQWTSILDKNGLSLSVNVWIVNSAIKNIHHTDLLVIDEIHKFASKEFYKIFENFGYSLILGLTATFERLDGKEKYLSIYCPVVDVITFEEATKKGWLAESKIYKVMIDVDDIDVYNSYNRTFMEHFSYFGFDFQTAMSCVSSYEARVAYVKQLFLFGANANPDEFKKELSECAAHAFAWNKALSRRKAFIFNHPKKIEIAEKILAKRPNAKAITFSATLANCNNFKDGIIISSKNSKKKNKELLEEFNKSKKGVVHSSKALIEGADIKGLNLAILLYNSSSMTERVQKYGRVVRAEEGKIAEIFSLVIRGTVEESWFKKSAAKTRFIEINENDLDAILDYHTLERREQTQDTIKSLLTY